MDIQNLIYNKSKSPIENVNTFFDAVKSPLYEWVEVKREKGFGYILYSPWNGADGLKDITLNFQEEFHSHLIETSMSEYQTADYTFLLKECKARLKNINHYYKPSFNNLRIITRIQATQGESGMVKFESLPDSAQDTIIRSHELLIIFFRELEDCVSEEMKDHERTQYVVKESSYEWFGEKNDLSELALAIFAQGDFKIRGTKKMMPNTFAREFAAFFGIDKLNFRQDIENIHSRPKRKPGEFIDKCKLQFLEYLNKDRRKK